MRYLQGRTQISKTSVQSLSRNLREMLHLDHLAVELKQYQPQPLRDIYTSLDWTEVLDI
jgi:hypothetical protein